jgi:hypothetical protein
MSKLCCSSSLVTTQTLQLGLVVLLFLHQHRQQQMQKQLEGSFEEAMLKSDTNDYGGKIIYIFITWCGHYFEKA